MPVELSRTMTLSDEGEESTAILLVGEFRQLTDDQLRWLAAEHIHREQEESPEDALDQVRSGRIERGLWRWVPAPEGSPHDEIIQKVDPLKDDQATVVSAFQAVQVATG